VVYRHQCESVTLLVGTKVPIDVEHEVESQLAPLVKLLQAQGGRMCWRGWLFCSEGEPPCLPFLLCSRREYASEWSVPDCSLHYSDCRILCWRACLLATAPPVRISRQSNTSVSQTAWSRLCQVPRLSTGRSPCRAT